MSGLGCKDVICGTLTVKGRPVISSNGDIKANNLLVTKEMVVNGSLNVKGVDTTTTSSCIIEPTGSNENIIIDKPIFNRRHGLVKLGLEEKVTVEGSDKILLTPDEWDWNILLESIPASPLLALQNTSLFTVPGVSDYVNECMPANWKMIVEVNIILPYFTYNYESEDIIQLGLVVNKDDNDYEDNEGIISSSIKTVRPNDTMGLTLENLQLHDIVLLSPEDTLDILIRTETGNINSEINLASEIFGDFVENPWNVAYATFKILGFQDVEV